jgi:hypothetical protein
MPVSRLRPVVLTVIAAAAFIGLALSLSSFVPTAVTVEWSTATELNTVGFNLYRADTENGPFQKVNTDLIPASPDPLVGGTYTFTDTNVVAGRTYYYRLEDVETSGAATAQGTVQVTAEVSPLPYLLLAATFAAAAILIWRK